MRSNVSLGSITPRINQFVYYFKKIEFFQFSTCAHPIYIIKTVRLYRNRYFRPWPQMPLIFSKVYYTFWPTRTSFLRLRNKGRPPGEVSWKTARKFLTTVVGQIRNRLLVRRVPEIKMVKMAPRRRSESLSM